MGDGCLNPYLETNYMIGSEMVEETEMLKCESIQEERSIKL